MSLRINDQAPNFQTETTQGRIDFHDWIGDKWAVLFSHPKDFTPVCTTELGYMASIQSEFDKRDTKLIGLSIDSINDHQKWLKDVEEVGGSPIYYPPHQESLNIFGYYARIYSNGNAIGEQNNNIYFYDGGATGTGDIILIGPIADFLPHALSAGF